MKILVSAKHSLLYVAPRHVVTVIDRCGFNTVLKTINILHLFSSPRAAPTSVRSTTTLAPTGVVAVDHDGVGQHTTPIPYLALGQMIAGGTPTLLSPSRTAALSASSGPGEAADRLKTVGERVKSVQELVKVQGQVAGLEEGLSTARSTIGEKEKLIERLVEENRALKASSPETRSGTVVSSTSRRLGTVDGGAAPTGALPRLKDARGSFLKDASMW